MAVCAPLVRGATAFDSTQLVAQGGIPETSVVNDEEIQLLPANRISIELEYSVQSNITGTNLGDLAGSGGLAGLAAGVGLVGGLGCQLVGDFEPTLSQFIFHLADGENRFNEPITVTEDMVQESFIDTVASPFGAFSVKFDNPIGGVLSVTPEPVEFTDEQRDDIGVGPGIRRGHRISADGQIEAPFVPDDNMFSQIVRDQRKFDFRGDNSLRDRDTNVFINNGSDDLVDDTILIQIPNQDPEQLPDLQVGDVFYITYYVITRDIIRHAIETRSFYFLFPNFSVDRIGNDEVKAWNFKPFTFKVRKNHGISPFGRFIRGDLDDLAFDQGIREDPDLSEQEKEQRFLLEDIKGQRLVEVLNNTRSNRPYIRGYYIADVRGIFAVDYFDSNNRRLIVPADQINDQEWWNNFINEFIDFGPGFTDSGEINFVDVNGLGRLIKGFLFDVSDHVNMAVFDNEKYGYQRDLAMALGSVSTPNPENPDSTGVGVPNLDLMELGVSGRQRFDLSSARFINVEMSSVEGGAYFVRSCNELFTFDQQFCSSGTIQADMFIRTPFFFLDLAENSRVFIERFSPQNPLAPDGGIWVFTNPVASLNQLTFASHPKSKRGFLVFMDSTGSEPLIKWHDVRDSDYRKQVDALEHDVLDKEFNHDKPDIAQVTQENLDNIGFDKLLGNQPSYSSGREIVFDNGLISRKILNSRDIYKRFTPTFDHNQENGTINITDLDNKRIKQIRIEYDIIGSLPSIESESVISYNSISNKFAMFIMPNEGHVIDSVLIPSHGAINLDARYYFDTTMRIQGEVLRGIKNVKIEMITISDDAYARSRLFAAGGISSCFDRKGNWYVFYEDFKANQGEFESPSENLSVVEGGTTEISCAISNDLGETWFDHKGIVYTAGDEKVFAPQAIANNNDGNIHLFYVLNNNLMHKKIKPVDFVYEDSFKAWKRPASFDEDTPSNFPIEHFTESGKNLRKIESYVVVGNFAGDYLPQQLEISRQRKETNGFVRILSGEFSVESREFRSFPDGFSQTEYAPFIDSKGTLYVAYASGGANLFIRYSIDGGKTWRSHAENAEGFPFHRHNFTESPSVISNIGAVVDNHNGYIHITYISDGMLFVRSFDTYDFNIHSSDEEVLPELNPDSPNTKPMFCVGQLSESLLRGVNNANTNVFYPYPLATSRLELFQKRLDRSSTEAFDQSMAIGEVASDGFVSSVGRTRLYYRDAEGNIRGLSYSLKDVLLDVKFKQIENN